MYSTKLSKLLKYWELYTALLNLLGSRNLEEQKYIMHQLSQFFSIEANFVPSGKRIKRDFHQLTWHFLEEQQDTLCLTTKGMNILIGLEVKPVNEKLRRCKSNWLRHVAGMNNNRMPEIMLNCRPDGRRRHGRRLQRALDEAETVVLKPISWLMMMMMTIFRIMSDSISKYTTIAFFTSLSHKNAIQSHSARFHLICLRSDF